MLVECNNELDWDIFNKESPHGTIYSTSFFINSLNIPNKKLFFIKNNEKVASILLINNEGIPTFSMYQGLCISGAELKGRNKYSNQLKISKELIELLVKDYNKINIQLSHRFEDLRAFQWYNYDNPEKGVFNIDLGYTGIIPLKLYNTFAEYLSTIRSVRRQEYKKGLTNNFKIIESNKIDDFIRLYNLTFERQGIKIEDNAIMLITSIIINAIKNNYGKLFYCIDENSTVHSANVILEFKETRYYAFGATDPIQRGSGASVYLMLENIKNAYESGIKYFDMVGMNSPNRGDFKLSFNAIPVPYFSINGLFK